ncbi:hypothetical protein [Crocosphaera sp.]|uniref:hypothetical protein n=1 Tax=Crocosphaera sp. TaxID=2729996 RepID=UPI002622A24B|nr:hypothetical protein [Crocosphaera sp.]MDJ0579291.1 hypothetical protein [Crocosphaera sp.]
MYINDDQLNNKSQAVASTDLSLLVSDENLQLDDNTQDEDNQTESSIDSSLDPVGIFIWEIVENLLERRGQITTKEVLEVIEEREGSIKPGDSAVRERLSQLTDLGYLECVPGSGRRPSYYFFAGDERLENHTIEPSDTEILDNIKQQQSKIRQQIDDLQQQLEELLTDQEEMEEVIQKRQKLRSKYR